jgi:hypothetical protein
MSNDLLVYKIVGDLAKLFENITNYTGNAMVVSGY